MKSKIIISFLIVLSTYLCYGLVFNNSLSVHAGSGVSKSKIKIRQGFFSINRKNDEELFKEPSKTIFNGFEIGFLVTDYGENDFLVTYDDVYYFEFRHFITNRNDRHIYNFDLYKNNDTVFCKVNIYGVNGMQFTRPMQRISDAKDLCCNTLIDTTKNIYNMLEMK